MKLAKQIIMCRLVLEITFPTNGLKVKKKVKKNKRGRGGGGGGGGRWTLIRTQEQYFSNLMPCSSFFRMNPNFENRILVRNCEEIPQQGKVFYNSRKFFHENSQKVYVLKNQRLEKRILLKPSCFRLTFSAASQINTLCFWYHLGQ